MKINTCKRLFALILVAVLILSGCSDKTQENTTAHVNSGLVDGANDGGDGATDGGGNANVGGGGANDGSGSANVGAGYENGSGGANGGSGNENSGGANDNNGSAESDLEFINSDSSLPYIYTEPMYNLPSSYVFTFDIPYYKEAWENNWDYDYNFIYDFKVFVDDQFRDGTDIFVDTDYDMEKGVLTVSPLFPTLQTWDTIDDSIEPFWGNAPKYWLVRYRDMKTGDLFDKPLVTVFTVKHELSTPTIHFDITKDGYASLEWDAVPGADRYVVYRLTIYNDKSIGDSYLFTEGETSDTFFVDFERIQNLDEYGEVWVMNEAFYDPDDYNPDARDAFCVMALSSNGTSCVSNFIFIHDYYSRLPNIFSGDYLGSGEGDDGTDYRNYPIFESVRSLPSYALVEMCDGSIVPMVLDYQSATYELDPFWDSWLEIAIKIVNTDLTCHLTLSVDGDVNAEKEFNKNLSFLIKRQKQLPANASYVPPSNNISYTPPVDVTLAQNNSDTISANISAVEDMRQRVERNEIRVYSNSALSEYLAMNMLMGVERINITAFNEANDMDYLVNALFEALRQNPLIGSVSVFGYDYSANEIIIEYDFTPDEMKSMQDAVIAEVNKVVSEIIDAGMSELEKEIAINQYLLETAEYDFKALENAEKNNFKSVDKKYMHSFTPYGVLINKVGVCASYAGAFKLLGDAAGLDVVVVTGYLNGNLPHAWNRVLVDGDWMTVDSTNNDNVLENALFNVPDRMVSGILVEDDNYILKSVLLSMTGESETLEWYRITNNYYPPAELEPALAQGLLGGDSFCVRTDYDMAELDVILLLLEAMDETGVTWIEGCYYWIGVIYVEF